MKNISPSNAFTLIEIIVSITIFGIIMTSVMSIFILSSKMSTRIELSRSMHENIKNVTEDIAESVRKNDIAKILDNTQVSPCVSSPSSLVGSGTKLCIKKSDTSMYIAYYIGNKNASGDWQRVMTPTNCQDTSEDAESICRVIREIDGVKTPLTNNLVAVEDLNFMVSNENIPRVTLRAKIRPSYQVGISSNIVENNTLSLQTTLSERTIITQ